LTPTHIEKEGARARGKSNTGDGCGGGSKNGVSLYAVLSVTSDCSNTDLHSAYRMLAMASASRWR
jgi:hypothetical protein